MLGIRYCDCCGQPIIEEDSFYYCGECRETIENEKKENPDYLRDYLKKYCLGKENAEFSHEIEKRFLISGRDLRRIISGLREKGEPICSDFHHGYYYAKNQDEINGTVRGLNEHVTGVSNTITDLRNAELKREPGPSIIRKIIIVISTDEDSGDELVMEFV